MNILKYIFLVFLSANLLIKIKSFKMEYTLLVSSDSKEQIQCFAIELIEMGYSFNYNAENKNQYEILIVQENRAYIGVIRETAERFNCNSCLIKK